MRTFTSALNWHDQNDIKLPESFDFYSHSSWFAGLPFKFASGNYFVAPYFPPNNLSHFVCPRCSSEHPLHPLSCIAFCPHLDHLLGELVNVWLALQCAVVTHWWHTLATLADKRNYVSTLIPLSLWDALCIPGP